MCPKHTASPLAQHCRRRMLLQKESFTVVRAAPLLASQGPPSEQTVPAVVPKPTPWRGAERGWGACEAPAAPRHAGVAACPGGGCCSAAFLSPSMCVAGGWPHPISDEAVTERRPELCWLVPWMCSIALLRVMGWVRVWPCSC